MPLSDLRHEYRLLTLDRPGLSPEPIEQFRKWFEEAQGARMGRFRRLGIDLYRAFYRLFTGTSIDPNAMALATANIQGHPSVRTVLLKGVDARGFTFYTNHQSRKARELAANPWASIVFHWADLERQVIISGRVTQLSSKESDKYFQTRPRGSRIAAWASDQHSPLPDRAALEARWLEIEKQFHDREVPLPPFWGGYLLAPERIEFWQGRPRRLHDRFCYTRTDEGKWKIERLMP
jgi:pyridoxamine 5'-phosphate oxidase